MSQPAMTKIDTHNRHRTAKGTEESITGSCDPDPRSSALLLSGTFMTGH